MRLSFLQLENGIDQVEPGFRPHVLGVVIEHGARRWSPEWSLVATMAYDYGRGSPRHWCSDGHRVYFDCPASEDMRVTVSDQPLKD